MNLKDIITIYPDFPKPGISFKDINPILSDSEAYRTVIDTFYSVAKALDVNVILAPESRGYLFGAPLAWRLGASLIPVRKPGKLPGKVESQAYSLEYGSGVIEIQADAIKTGDRVLIVDDLLATGGTAKAVVDLAERLGAEVCGACFLVELTELGGRQLLSDYMVHSLVEYPC